MFGDEVPRGGRACTPARHGNCTRSQRLRVGLSSWVGPRAQSLENPVAEDCQRIERVGEQLSPKIQRRALLPNKGAPIAGHGRMSRLSLTSRGTESIATYEGQRVRGQHTTRAPRWPCSRRWGANRQGYARRRPAREPTVRRRGSGVGAGIGRRSRRAQFTCRFRRSKGQMAPHLPAAAYPSSVRSLCHENCYGEGGARARGSGLLGLGSAIAAYPALHARLEKYNSVCSGSYFSQ